MGGHTAAAPPSAPVSFFLPDDANRFRRTARSLWEAHHPSSPLGCGSEGRWNFVLALAAACNKEALLSSVSAEWVSEVAAGSLSPFIPPPPERLQPCPRTCAPLGVLTGALPPAIRAIGGGSTAAHRQGVSAGHGNPHYYPSLPPCRSPSGTFSLGVPKWDDIAEGSGGSLTDTALAQAAAEALASLACVERLASHFAGTAGRALSALRKRGGGDEAAWRRVAGALLAPHAGRVGEFALEAVAEALMGLGEEQEEMEAAARTGGGGAGAGAQKERKK